MFARPDQDLDGGSLPARFAGKATRFLARHIRSKTLMLRGTPAMVTFTFDDVPASACGLGASILEAHGACGTFYVAARGCCTANSGGPRLASIEQLRAIWTRGHEIGCHTYSHPAVSRISLAELGAELERNRSALQSIHGDIEVRNFAYPYGDLSLRSKRYLQARFDSCRSVHPGINRGVADLGSLRAWPLEDATIDRAQIAALIAAAARENGWLIFYSHEVADRPNRFGVSPDLLEFAVATARRSGCVLCTVAGAMQIAGYRSRPIGRPLPISPARSRPQAPRPRPIAHTQRQT
jgi:peptidoglycan/xylan/chitin deacetylase (PgdA/CDA1 family)